MLDCTTCDEHWGCTTRVPMPGTRRHGNGQRPVPMLSIINDILDLSKVEAGKLEVESVRTSPCEIIAEVASLARVRVEAKGLKFELEFGGPIPEYVQTDPTRLRPDSHQPRRQRRQVHRGRERAPRHQPRRCRRPATRCCNSTLWIRASA